MTKLLLAALLTISLLFNYQLSTIRDTVTFTELSISCETGMLLYVLKYDQGPLTTMQKVERSREVANACANYASTYLEIKPLESKPDLSGKGNEI